MANELSVELFERNAKAINKNGMLRSYDKIITHGIEYTKTLPIGYTNKLVLEVVVDKEFVEKLKELFKNEGYDVLGGNNYYFLGEMVKHYHQLNIKDEKIRLGFEAIEKDYKLQKEENVPFTEKDNGDVIFYVMPYKDGVNNLSQFISETKNIILDFAVKNDITIVINFKGFTNQISGFMGFNFYDADGEEDEGVEVDYASNIYVSVDFKKGSSVYMAAAYLWAIAENKEDLELVNTHILTDDAKIK